MRACSGPTTPPCSSCRIQESCTQLGLFSANPNSRRMRTCSGPTTPPCSSCRIQESCTQLGLFSENHSSQRMHICSGPTTPPCSSYRIQESCTQPHCKKRFSIFPSPTGMSLTKLFLAGNNLIILGQREFG
jgi:hypothetical protein